MTQSQVLGKLGEELAKSFLIEKGYEYLESNYSCRFGEIDLVMKKEDRIVFVEVKTRKPSNTISGTANLPDSKLQKLESTALAWIEEFGDHEWGLELVEIIAQPNGLAKVKRTEI